ncbi:MAG: hypothetical protein ACYDER_22915 [Ktedonobacteraceae bacterium]
MPQADIVHTDLTVEKALYCAAKLRLPEDYSEQQIKHRISEVLAAKMQARMVGVIFEELVSNFCLLLYSTR